MRKYLSIAAITFISTALVFLIISSLRDTGNRQDSQDSGEAAGHNPLVKPATLRIVFPLEQPRAHDEVIRAVEAKLAKDGLPLKLEFTYIPFNQYWNKVWLLSATGEPYDLVLTAYSNLADLVSKKVVAPLEQALQTHGRAIIESTPDYALQGVTINGSIYGIPRVMPMAEFQSFLQIRGDLRKKYNLPEITTSADMDRYLEAVAQYEPDMVPYFYDTGKFLLREYGNVAFLAGSYMNSPVYIDPSDPQLRVRNTYESAFFRDIMGKMHEWQRKGYIPYGPSDFSRIPDPEAGFNEGQMAATWSVVMKQTERIDAFKAKLPFAELENVYLHPQRPKYLFTAADNMLSVLSTSTQVNESVAFVNWLRSSQENYDLFTYGIRNVNYKLEGDALSYDGIAPEHRYHPISWAWNDIRYERFNKHISKEYAAQLRNWDKDAIASPTLGFVPDLTPIKSEMVQLQTTIREYLALLYEEDVDWNSTMDKFRAKLKDAGMEHVIAELQKQFDDYIEKQNSK